MCDYTRIDKIHNDYIHKRVKVTPITKKNCRKSFELVWIQPKSHGMSQQGVDHIVESYFMRERENIMNIH